eukprot:EG_transcript_3427
MTWLLLLLLFEFIVSVAAVNATHIVIGQTIALSGTSASSGNRSGYGLRAAFQEVNDAGGIMSRNLTLVALDDQGLGPLSLQNVITLNASYDPLVIVGTYGTAPLAFVLPFLARAQIPLVGPFSGLALSRSPFQEVAINLRPSFADETMAQAHFLVEFLRVQRIACFYTNDEIGFNSYATLVDALGYVGISLVASAVFVKNVTAPNITAPLEAILAANARPQAVVLLCLEPDIAQFVLTFRKDPRADPNCAFIFLSVSSAATLRVRLGPGNWHNLFFTRTVPMPDADYGLSRRFSQVEAKYIPPDLLTDQLTFESYVAGRFIVEVLKGVTGRRLDRKLFLDEVYNTRLYYLDDIPVGLYGRNFSGCEYSICACNSGMRRVYIATFDPLTGKTVSDPCIPTAQYPLTQCAASKDIIQRPIIFGQLLPVDDPLVAGVARTINAGLLAAFADLNAAGGLNGRQYQLVSANYSGDPANATAALADRWPLVALLGSVVGDGVALPATIPRIATFDFTVRPRDIDFVVDDIRTQSSIPLEMMALSGYVVQQGATPHLRVRRGPTSAALLATLAKSINTLQYAPASVSEFDVAAAALDGLSAGYVIGIGTTQDLLDWVRLLQGRPSLTLLTVKQSALLLLYSGKVKPNSTVMGQLLFPFVLNQQDPGQSSDAFAASFAFSYGYNNGIILGKVMSQSAITLSSTFTTPASMVKAWYDAQVVKMSNAIFGPYYAANCSQTGGLQCECNLGARSVAIVSCNPQSNVFYRYQMSTCKPEYKPLLQQRQPPSAAASDSLTLSVALGVVLGVAFLLAVAACLALRGKRNNRAAPKDPSQPYC